MIQPNAEWDDYWRTARSQNHKIDPTGTDATAPFFLAERPLLGEASYVMDLGCGAGTLSQILKSANYCESHFLGVDLSLDAAQMTANKIEGMAIQGDLSQLPVASASVDWVVSQFALEYAPSEAWQEVARVVKRGGRLTVVAHAVGSLIHEEHQQAQRDFVELDRIVDELFATDDEDDSSPLCDRNKLLEARTKVEAALAHKVTGLAKPMTDAFVGATGRLTDVKMKLAADDLAPLRQWLADYQLYKRRIESMVSAALTPADFMHIQQGLVSAGFTIQTAGFLTLSSGARLGFKLSAQKGITS